MFWKRIFDKWDYIVHGFVPDNFLTGKHGPCPVCGGKDRFRYVRNESGRWFCNQCGTGRGLDLIVNYTGLDRNSVIKQIKEMLNDEGDKMNTEELLKEKRKKEKNVRRIKSILSNCTEIQGTLAERYLKKRGILDVPKLIDVKYSAAVPYFEDGEKKGVFPCVVSIVRGLDKKVKTIHLIYLDSEGNKLDVKSNKKILPAVDSFSGCYVRVSFEKGCDYLTICEGVETAVAIASNDGGNVVAALNASNMEKLIIPEQIKNVRIYADEDKTFTGQASAYSLAKKLTLKGHSVSVMRILNNELFIDESNKNIDFLDLYGVNVVSGELINREVEKDEDLKNIVNEFDCEIIEYKSDNVVFVK